MMLFVAQGERDLDRQSGWHGMGESITSLAIIKKKYFLGFYHFSVC
jgi:hypothetical protein